MSAINQRQVLKQLQKLSPQQIQMIKLLELPTLQLEQRIKQELEENPILDEQDATDDSEDGAPKDVSMEEYLREDDTPSYKSYINNFSRDDKTRQMVLFEGCSMHDYLIEQLAYANVEESDRLIAQYIVGNIDDDGYLRIDLQSVSDDIAFSYGEEVSIEELERGLRIIQSLEPPGIGARDIQECLLLQIDRKRPFTNRLVLARKILSSYFVEFTKKHFEKIMQRLNISECQFRDVIEEIQKLSPKPGNLYIEGGNIAAPYIIPDFILEEREGILLLRLNSYNIPELKVNRQYVDMIRQMSNSNKGNSSEDKEALQFVKNKIDSAKWFISAIKQRHDTLLRTMQAIVDYQREYFLEGSESKLKPMILKDIADLTGLDVSTISRVVNSKYVQTAFGIVSLKQLFSEAMQTDSGEEVSSYEIKNILIDCIGKEDKQKPLTDEALMDILNDMGYHIARRTVAKYREMLDVPVARLRKEL